MLRTVCGAAASLLIAAAFSASCADVDCHDVLCKASNDAGASGTDATTDGGGNVTPPPAGCDPAAEPKASPKCVVDEYGVFVDAIAGSDANPGTMTLPAKTITAALVKLAGKPRVYVCNGTYPESVAITSAISLYGGFACGSWTYDGSVPTVAPAVTGDALAITGVASSLVISDLAFRSADATLAGDSSIAAFVQASPAVSFLRVKLEAGNGANGADGADGVTGKLTAVSSGAMSLAGNPASGVAPGVIKTCTCVGGDTSTGGSGGPTNGSGQAGAPTIPPNPVGQSGSPGEGGKSCSGPGSTGSGVPGANALAALNGAKVNALGMLTATGWTPQAGVAGPSGKPGQGGGGGGGRDVTSAGGSGACGGCAGAGGQLGGGGGASVALLVLDAPVALRDSSLVSHNAGRGGSGGASGVGAAGGSAANGGPSGCSGGEGGGGGAGGAGSGGAGGISTAILVKGDKPSFDTSTLAFGIAGAKGTGGAPGSNDGPDGAAANLVEAP